MASATLNRSDSESSSAFDRWRDPISRLLLVIFMVSAGLAVPAIWARNQVLDTDAFVRTVTPLGEDPAFQDAIANRVTSIVSSEISSSNLVTENDGVLATVVPLAATAAVDSIVTSFVHSPRFPAVWEDTARIAHTGFDALITGGESDLYNSADGQVSIDLTPIVQVVLDDLAARGITINPPQQDLTFVVFESSTLAEVQSVTKRLNELAVVLSLIALISLLAYVIVSPHHLAALMVAALGLALSMLVVLLFISGMRWLYLRELSNDVDKDAARGMFDMILRYLRWGLRITGLVALAVAGAIYLKLRHQIHFDSSEEAERSFYARFPVLGRFENSVAENRLASAGIWSALIAALLLIQNWTDFGWVIVLLVVGIAGLILIQRAKPVPEELRNPVKSPPVAETTTGAMVSQSLQQVADLNASGQLTDDEFAMAKTAILAGS